MGTPAKRRIDDPEKTAPDPKFLKEKEDKDKDKGGGEGSVAAEEGESGGEEGSEEGGEEGEDLGAAELEGASAERMAAESGVELVTIDSPSVVGESIHIWVQGVAGQRDLKRQLRVSAPVVEKKVKRLNVPPPLCSGKEKPNEAIGDLAEFDRGHLVALSLGGADDHQLIVPLQRFFNRHGYWREVEQQITNILTNAPKAMEHASSLGEHTVLDEVIWRMEVELFYNDRKTDVAFRFEPRIPVFFYIRLYHGDEFDSHYLFANRCAGSSGSVEVRLEEEDKVNFLALEDLYAALVVKDPDGYLALTPAQPYLILEFAHDYNYCFQITPDQADNIYKDTSRRKGFGDAYFGMAAPVRGVWPFVEELTKATSRDHVSENFDNFLKAYRLDNTAIFPWMEFQVFKGREGFAPQQRVLIQKYNMWRNWKTDGNARLTSDVTAATRAHFPGEQDDPYPVLNYCAGRSYPEVDHIAPSRKLGENSYDNARLVSFVHNHVFRDKDPSGSEPVSAVLLREFQEGELVFTDGVQFVYWGDSKGKAEEDDAIVEKKLIKGDAPSLNDKRVMVAKSVTDDVSAQAFLDARLADNIQFKMGADKFAMNRGRACIVVDDQADVNERNKAKSLVCPGVPQMVANRMKYLNAQLANQKRYTDEQALAGAYLLVAQKHDLGVQDFLADNTHPGRQALAAMVKEIDDSEDFDLGTWVEDANHIEGGFFRVEKEGEAEGELDAIGGDPESLLEAPPIHVDPPPPPPSYATVDAVRASEPYTVLLASLRKIFNLD